MSGAAKSSGSVSESSGATIPFCCGDVWDGTVYSKTLVATVEGSVNGTLYLCPWHTPIPAAPCTGGVGGFAWGNAKPGDSSCPPPEGWPLQCFEGMGFCCALAGDSGGSTAGLTAFSDLVIWKLVSASCDPIEFVFEAEEIICVESDPNDCPCPPADPHPCCNVDLSNLRVTITEAP